MAKLHCIWSICVIILCTLCNKNSPLALSLTPTIRIPNLPICAPNEVPPIDLPDDFLTCSEEVAENRDKIHPDVGKRTDEIVASYGYSSEIHNVTTWDGYILTVYRITGGPKSPPARGKPAVYFNHGILGNSDNWLLVSSEKNLPFKLVDAGYEVWLSNCRGNSYSLGHETLNSETDSEYWEFSWHEMGVGDVPAVVDKIISVSGNEKILFVAHSMGTTEYFVALSEVPSLNDKLIAAVLLAPAAYMGHATNVLRLVGVTVGVGAQNVVGPVTGQRVDELTEIQKYFGLSLGDLCTPTATRCGVCDNLIPLLFEFDAPQTNYTNLPLFFDKIPDNVSIKTVSHFAQSMNTCGFRQYDYGPSENVARYGTLNPPSYNLSAITVPTYFFHSDQDNLVQFDDVQITLNHMQPGVVKEVIRVDWNLFNHVDFIFAKDADTLVYNKVLQILNNVINKSE
ncbi:Lipase 3 [Orchesella cincta]|uniref:Lipase 3 n=1 Tax=Orchesella cincta TaxID=48709 RepID=A0A1D2N1K9_ORCCI|nr:Lipase 3 [Orchesella cincta]